MLRNKRDSRIELIRILSMILILIFHITIYSPINIMRNPLSFNLLFHILFGVYGKVGVILFVMISSWFTTSEKNKVIV